MLTTLGLMAAINVTQIDLTSQGVGFNVTKAWIGSAVSSVLTGDNISKVVVLEAVTSAPLILDVENILESIKRASVFENPTGPMKQIIWRVLIVKKDGSYVHYVSDGKTVCIVTNQGSGIFTWN